MWRPWRILRSPRVRLFLGVAIVLALVYYLAPHLGFGSDQRWTLVALIGGMIVVALGTRWIRRRFDRRRRGSGRRPTPAKERRPELARLEATVEEVERTLQDMRPKRSLLELHRPDPRPRLLLLGPSGAGKSAALGSAGARLERLDRTGRAAGDDGACKWWLAKDVVFVDVPGRYLEPGTVDEWNCLLDSLARAREGQAVDTVILVVGLDQIIGLSSEQAEAIALRMGMQLDEMTARLGVSFPIHLIFNRCDCLDGFVDLFDGLPRSERLQPWGFRLDAASLGPGSLEETFLERYRTMVSWLEERVTPRLRVLESNDSRLSVIAFPAELERHGELLATFTSALLEPGRRGEQPLAAGVYFTSAAQDGRRNPGVRQALIRELDAGETPAFVGTRPSSPYFVAGTFERISRLAHAAARPTARAIRTLRKRQYIALGVGTTVVFLASLYLTLSHVQNKGDLESLVARAEAVSAYRLPNSSQRLDPVYTLQTLRAQEKLEQALRVGPDSALLAAAYRQGEVLLRTLIDLGWIVPLGERIEERLARGMALRPDSPGEQFAEGFTALKAAAVIGRSQCPDADPVATHGWIAGYLRGVWEEALGERAPDTLGGATGELLEQRVQFFFEGSQPSRAVIDDDLSERTRAALTGLAPAPEVAFHLIVSNAGLSRRQPQLRGDLFVDPGLEEVFTGVGCRAFMKRADEGSEWWSCLLGIGELPPVDKEAEFLKRFHTSRNAWLNALALGRDVVDIRSSLEAFGALVHPVDSELTQVLKAMGEPESPRQEARRKEKEGGLGLPIRGRARFYLRWFDKLRGWWSEETAMVTENPVCSDALARFHPFAAAIGEDDPENVVQTSYKEYQEAIRALIDRLQRIEDSSSPNVEALAVVRERMKPMGELYDLAQARRKFFERLEEGPPRVDAQSLSNLMIELETRVWRVLVRLASSGLQEQWTTDIYQVWSDIRYSSRRDRDLEMEACQRVQSFLTGELEQYINGTLSHFYRAGDWRACELVTLMDTPFPLEPSICRKIKRAVQVGRTVRCPEPTTRGGGASPGKPLRIEVQGPQECQGRLEYVGVDTGDTEYICRVARGMCIEQTDTPSVPKPA